ncbi:DNA-packaging protein gp3 [uncultured Caudovirales phage]|uniref:DNA-packaging protein gp3 n=1 Tax=uncultured Caudovirales phage TaxID=2100421 RepID=A0A6J5S5W4_9CAUD|nr:DNA-packaging protein gp3 [uncultured Caudovirales phage]
MAKHKYIETPELMAQLFEDYKTECKSNPRKKHVFVGKDGTSDYELLERPLTIEGFRVYCYDKIGCVKQYFDNPDKRYNEYITICSHIREVIRRDQIEGGMVGQYNPSITQRLNGLKESIEQTNIEQPLFPKD